MPIDLICVWHRAEQLSYYSIKTIHCLPGSCLSFLTCIKHPALLPVTSQTFRGHFGKTFGANFGHHAFFFCAFAATILSDHAGQPQVNWMSKMCVHRADPSKKIHHNIICDMIAGFWTRSSRQKSRPGQLLFHVFVAQQRVEYDMITLSINSGG